MNENICQEDLGSLIFDDWDELEDGGNNSNKSYINVSHFNSSTNQDTSNNLDISALCCDEELNGFDKNSGPTWIYPTNYSVRDYQYNIVKAALFKNTLVSLPTGLGKTFIAAVVMYNYYRWYPLGKIIFTAPTRPLVAQQIDACYNITAIPPEDTIEMTGSMQISARKIAWQQKRVFFATPQVVHNDLESGACPGALVRCLVIDEAHRARGRHSYCQLVEALALRKYTLFRVLALSATPGSKVEDVINVVKNLQISHLELRSENCLDVAMYSHSRKIQTVVVPLGEDISNIRQRYIQILDIYTRRLVQYKILTGNIGNLSKGRIIMLYKEYQNKEKSMRHPQHQTIMHDFTMVITLFHALELLTKHGARVFLNFFDDHTDKGWVGRDDTLTCFLERLRDDLGTNPFSINRETLPDGTVPEITEELKFGHPKFDNLKEIMIDHFNSAKSKGQETKAIIFCEYRESVHLVHCLLLQCRPTIRPHVFLGQGLGSSGATKDQNMKPFSQKQQLRVMKMFREGTCNVLVSTSVGEEGLDVGNVDLIVCFDISNKSPVRLVQRCGRTGRERGGRVVILVTEGREHQTLRECISQRDSLNKRVLQSKELLKNLYKSSPTMIPNNLKPECQKMFITVAKKNEVFKNSSKKSIKDMFLKRGADSNQATNLTNEEYLSMYPNGFPTFSYFPETEECWNMSKSALLNSDQSNTLYNKPKVDISEWMEWQRSLQYSVTVHHSSDSQMLAELLQYADAKRFNSPLSTQNPSFATQLLESTNTKPKQLPTKKVVKNSNQTQKKKNVDIRDLFNKLNKNNNEEQIIFDAKLKETLEDCGVTSDDKLSKDLLLEKENVPSILVDLMVELNIEKSKQYATKKYSKFNAHLVTSKNLMKATPSGLSPSWSVPPVPSVNELKHVKYIDIQALVPKEHNYMNMTCEESPVKDQSKSWEHLDKSLGDISYLSFKDENTLPNPLCKINNQLDVNFDIGDIDDIFGNTPSPKENIPSVDKEQTELASEVNDQFCTNKNPLDFFGLEDVEDIFADDCEESYNNVVLSNKILKVNTPPSDVNKSLSPILHSQRIQSNFNHLTFNDNVSSISFLKEKVSNSNSTCESKNIGYDNSTWQSKNIGCDTLENKQTHNYSYFENSVSKMSCKISPHNKKSTTKGDNTTLFTITQMIDIINEPEKIETKDKECSDESDSSLILCSQIRKKTTIKRKLNSPHKPHLTIVETSESSSDDSVIITDSEKRRDTVKNANVPIELLNSVSRERETTIKRKLNSSDEFNEFSPFFKRTAFLNSTPNNKLTQNQSSKLSLKEKLNASTNNNFVSDSITDVETCSKKEQNYNDGAKILNGKIDQSIKINNISQLEQFAKPSQPQWLSKKTSTQKSKSKMISIKCGKQSDDSEDDDFVEKPSPKKAFERDSRKKERACIRKKKRRKPRSEFIHYEAEISDDSFENSSDENVTRSSDELDSSIIKFICDEDHIDNDVGVDMEAKYLQSVRSPVKRHGQFKIPVLPSRASTISVYSQIDPDEHTTYVLDSFCVDGDNDLLTQKHEISELEIAEAILKKRKRRKRKDKMNYSFPEEKHTDDPAGDSPIAMNKKKRRACFLIESESSTDEDLFA